MKKLIDWILAKLGLARKSELVFAEKALNQVLDAVELNKRIVIPKRGEKMSDFQLNNGLMVVRYEGCIIDMAFFLNSELICLANETTIQNSIYEHHYDNSQNLFEWFEDDDDIIEVLPGTYSTEKD